MTSLDETAERVPNADENEKVKQLQNSKTRGLNGDRLSLVGARVENKEIRLH